MGIGFLWIFGIAFSFYHHTAWMAHSQNLQGKEEIKRIEATRALRDLSLNLKNYYRIILLPSGLILVGGILNGLNTSKQNQPAQVNPCNPPDNPRIT